MSRGNFKITPDHSEVDREPTGQGSSWLDRFAESYAKEVEGKTAVEVARERMEQMPSLHDQIHSIMNGRPSHQTVEDAVKDYQERTGLTEYLKEAQAGQQVEDAAKVIKEAVTPDPKLEKLKKQFPEGMPGLEQMKEITSPARGLTPDKPEEGMLDPKIVQMLAQIGEQSDEDEPDPQTAAEIEAVLSEEDEPGEDEPAAETAAETSRAIPQSFLEALNSPDVSDQQVVEMLREMMGYQKAMRGESAEADDNAASEKKKSKRKGLADALEKLLEKLKGEDKEEKPEKKKEDEEEEVPEVVQALPEIAQFIQNVIENSPGIHYPAVVQLIAETFGRDLSPNQLDDPVLIRYIDKRRRPPKGTEYSATLGRGLGTQRDTDLFGDILNNDPFSFGRPSSRY